MGMLERVEGRGCVSHHSADSELEKSVGFGRLVCFGFAGHNADPLVSATIEQTDGTSLHVYLDRDAVEALAAALADAK